MTKSLPIVYFRSNAHVPLEGINRILFRVQSLVSPFLLHALLFNSQKGSTLLFLISGSLSLLLMLIEIL